MPGNGAHDHLDASERRALQDDLIVYLLRLDHPPVVHWARDHGITRQTVAHWMGSADFQARWQAVARKMGFNPTRYKAVVDAIHEMAVNGSVSAASLWLKTMTTTPTYIGGEELLRDDGAALDPELMTDEQLDAALADFTHVSVPEPDEDDEVERPSPDWIPTLYYGDGADTRG